MNNYIDILPTEVSNNIYMCILRDLIHSDEFTKVRQGILRKQLQKCKSQKQLRQLGL